MGRRSTLNSRSNHLRSRSKILAAILSAAIHVSTRSRSSSSPSPTATTTTSRSPFKVRRILRSTLASSLSSQPRHWLGSSAHTTAAPSPDGRAKAGSVSPVPRPAAERVGPSAEQPPTTDAKALATPRYASVLTLAARGQASHGIRAALHPRWTASLACPYCNIHFTKCNPRFTIPVSLASRCVASWANGSAMRPAKRLVSPALRPSLCSPGRNRGPRRRALPAGRFAALGARARLSTDCYSPAFRRATIQRFGRIEKGSAK